MFQLPLVLSDPPPSRVVEEDTAAPTERRLLARVLSRGGSSVAPVLMTW